VIQLLKPERIANFEPVDAKALANLMLDWADDENIEVSPMKLQKLIFFPHADFLASRGTPLVKQEFEAWDYGPVVPSLYHAFKDFGSNPINTRATAFDPAKRTLFEPKATFDEHDWEDVRRSFDYFSKFTAPQLSKMSHGLDGAWRQARALFSNGLNMDRRISDDLIRRFHQPTCA
jgi:uncharacterized phage-associated protein